MKMSRKVNKRIITVFAFTIFIIGLVFVFQKDDQFRINSSAKKSDPLENYGPEVIGGSIKETGGTENKKSKSKFVIVDSYGVNGGEKEHGLSKSIDMAVEASEIFFGLEKKEALYFIGKIVEFSNGGKRNAKEPQIIKVPRDYKSIQLAIDNAEAGNIIKVAEGEYAENITMKEGVSVIGAGTEKTILNASGFGNAVTFKGGITAKTVLSGFTIKNSGKNLSGAMIEDSSPWIHDNIFINNEYNIYIKGGSFPVIQKNVIQFGNKGIQVFNFENPENGEETIGREDEKNQSESEAQRAKTKPIIINNLITDNKIGIDLYNSSALIEHNNISYNDHYKTYIGATYGIYLTGSSAEITGNIISDSGICDLCAGISVDEKSKNVVISYNDIWNNKNNFVCFGECVVEENNVLEDPMYADVIGGDYHLSKDSVLIGKAGDGLDMGIRW